LGLHFRRLARGEGLTTEDGNRAATHLGKRGPCPGFKVSLLTKHLSLKAKVGVKKFLGRTILKDVNFVARIQQHFRFTESQKSTQLMGAVNFSQIPVLNPDIEPSTA
jgi:hypothetical protein